jgi:hypothetical protein
MIDLLIVICVPPRALRASHLSEAGGLEGPLITAEPHVIN